jgi:hypothetical protein
MSEITNHIDYHRALEAIKQRIQSSQTRAVLAVNAELLSLYWDIGRQLHAWQHERAWGSAVVEQMASDLQKSYPGIKGFSRSSLFAMRQFYAFFGSQFEIVPQPVGQLPWGHVRTMLAKVKSVEDVLCYDQPTIGLILCKNKHKLDVEYALRDINKPMGVSSYITKEIPISIQSQLPTVQEIESELNALQDNDQE